MAVKISKTPETVPKTGSYKVEYGDQVRYFYYDDEPSRRLRPETMTSEQALEKAKEFAREEREKVRTPPQR
ncbi:hypothetical protein ACVISU_000064 [Bradyrhizobium sp. USDA 4452]